MRACTLLSSSLVVDAFLIVPGKAGESKGEGQGYQQKLAPISIVSSCLVKEREIVARSLRRTHTHTHTHTQTLARFLRPVLVSGLRCRFC